MRSVYAVIIILILLVCSAGCASFIPDITGAPKATPTKTVTKTPTKTPTPTQNFTPTMNVAAVISDTPLIVKTPTKVPTTTLPTPTPTPTGYYLIPPEPTQRVTGEPTIAIESNVSDWKLFSNNDFSVSYPAAWEEIQSYQPQPMAALYPGAGFIGDTRVVRFESGNLKTNFTAYVTDLRVTDSYDQDVGIAWSQRTITPRIPDISGTGGSMTNWEKRITPGETEYVIFDVVVPEQSAYYPYAYTERDFVSWAHVYTFRFNTDNLTEFKSVKDYIFKSLKAQERIYKANSEFP